MVIGEMRAARREMRTRRQECESRFRWLLTKAIVLKKIKTHSLIEIGDSLVSRDVLMNGKHRAEVISPYYARTYAEEASHLLSRLGWRLEMRRFWSFRRHPEDVGDIISHALSRWHYGTHADRIDLAEAKESGYRCDIEGFRKAAEETLMLLWFFRITFVQDH